MTWTTATLLTYLLVTLPVTIWVATILARGGRVFLEDVFRGEDGLADAVNRLLVVGFYLVTVGFVLLFVRAGGTVDDLDGLLRTLTTKVGVVLLVLGMLHVVNVMVLSSMRRRSRADAARAAHLATFVQHPYPVQPPR